MNNTINYYNQNAESFIANTQNADMHLTQERFLRLLDANTSILDFGCGFLSRHKIFPRERISSDSDRWIGRAVQIS